MTTEREWKMWNKNGARDMNLAPSSQERRKTMKSTDNNIIDDHFCNRILKQIKQGNNAYDLIATKFKMDEEIIKKGLAKLYNDGKIVRAGRKTNKRTKVCRWTYVLKHGAKIVDFNTDVVYKEIWKEPTTVKQFAEKHGWEFRVAKNAFYKLAYNGKIEKVGKIGNNIVYGIPNRTYEEKDEPLVPNIRKILVNSSVPYACKFIDNMVRKAVADRGGNASQFPDYAFAY